MNVRERRIARLLRDIEATKGLQASLFERVRNSLPEGIDTEAAMKSPEILRIIEFLASSLQESILDAESRLESLRCEND